LPAARWPNNAADVDDDHEGERGAEVVAGAAHHAGQPVADAVDQDQAAEGGQPVEQGAGPQAALEEAGERGPAAAVDRLVRPGDREVHVVAGGQLTGLLAASLGDQEAGGLGQVLRGQRDADDQRQDADPEGGAPAVLAAGPHADEAGQDAARLVRGHQGADEQRALAPGGVLGHQGQRGGQQAAEADAGQEAAEAEGADGGRGGAERGGQREQCGARDDDLLAADPVGDGARAQRADQHAEGGVAAEITGERSVDAERLVLEHVGQHGAVDEHVQAVEEDDQPAQSDGQEGHPVGAGGRSG
jgi:hypothetical protein